MISSAEVARLREETGAGVMDCKRALDEARGNFSAAKKILATNAQAIAKKKAERATNHGLVEVYVHANKIGVLLEILCESDFVAKNSDFKEFAHSLAMQIASMKPENTNELLGQNFIRDDSMTIKDLLNQTTAKIGENIKIKRFVRYELGEGE